MSLPITFPLYHYFVSINSSTERFTRIVCSDNKRLTSLNKECSQFSPVLTRKLGKLQLRRSIIINVKTSVLVALSGCVQFGRAAPHCLEDWLFRVGFIILSLGQLLGCVCVCVC